MDKLEFEGYVVNGIGRHRELVVPGRSLLPQAPEDWPETLAPGSVNVRITSYPLAWRDHGLAENVKALDTDVYPPQFLIPQSQFGNNQLRPTPFKPNCGIGQVWRATLTANGGKLDCWVLRRIDSALWDVLEVVSADPIRSRMKLDPTSNWPAIIALHGHWRA
jgi:hypothetical protein